MNSLEPKEAQQPGFTHQFRMHVNFDRRIYTSQPRQLDAICNDMNFDTEIEAFINEPTSVEYTDLGLYQHQPIDSPDRILYSADNVYHFALARRAMGTKLWGLMPYFFKAPNSFIHADITKSDFADKLAKAIAFDNSPSSLRKDNDRSLLLRFHL